MTSPPSSNAAPPAPPTSVPRFVEGSILRHIAEMTAAGAVGLMAIFLGDLANIYFLSLSGDEAVIAAVGYASSILFFSTSIAIGLSIAAASIVAPAVGASDHPLARRRSTHAHVLAFLVSAVASVVLAFLIGPILTAMGATGRAHALASVYLTILIPTTPLMALSMTAMSVLRSVGDARRSMLGTIWGAATNTALDMLLILYWGLGIEGAAIASLIARVVMTAVTLNGVARVHGLLTATTSEAVREDARMYFGIAVPAMLTNIAQPVSNAVVTSAVASFGDGAVSGWALISRIIPVAFGSIYALSGVVGPILGQNLGARRADRMRDVLTQSLVVVAVLTALAWLALWVFCDFLAQAFRATGEARALVEAFCRWQSPLFLFLGGVFIANAAFNTLGKPHYSTILNWTRATAGTVPLVAAGAYLDGARGAITGSLLAGVVFGILAVKIAYGLVDKIAREYEGVETGAAR